MSLNNQITSNFPKIAVADANGNITGLVVQSLSASGNVNIGSATNTTIGGGIPGQTLTPTSSGTLQWTVPQLNQSTGFVNTTRTTTGNLSAGATTITISGGYAADFQINNNLAFSPTPTNSYVISGRNNLLTAETGITFNTTGYYATGSFITFEGNRNYNGFIICNPVNGTVATATLGTGSYDFLNNITTFPVTAGNVYVVNSSVLSIVGNCQITIANPLTETVPSGTLVYQTALDPFSIIQVGNNMTATNTNQVLVIDTSQNLNVNSVNSNSVSATTISANTITSNNVGATVVYSGLASDMTSQSFPFATWALNSGSGVNYNTSAANLQLSSGGEFIYTTSLTKAVYKVSFSVASTGYTANAVAAYVSVSNSGTTSNVMAYLTGETFNGINYYTGSTTVALNPAPVPGATGGNFTIRLRAPTQLTTGNIDVSGSMVVTRIR